MTQQNSRSGDANGSSATPSGESGSSLGDNLAHPARSTTQDMVAQAGEQASVAADVVHQQSRIAGEYLTRNVNEYPLAALLIAGAIGYGIAYLIHGMSRQQWRNRREIEEAEEPRTLFMRPTDWS